MQNWTGSLMIEQSKKKTEQCRTEQFIGHRGSCQIGTGTVCTKFQLETARAFSRLNNNKNAPFT